MEKQTRLRGAMVLAIYLANGASLAGCAEKQTLPAASAAPISAPSADAARAVAGATATPTMPTDRKTFFTAIVSAPDRSADDRALDLARHPLELLLFLDLGPGMKVAELGAGVGYTTELLARAVAPTGVVYAQNPRSILEQFAEKPWSDRLRKPVMKSVVRVDRECDDPLPPGARDLDAVIDVAFYHDTVWLKADRNSMNRAIFEALRPSGTYYVIDNSGRPVSGVTEAQTLHRIEEHILRAEVEKVGFRLAAEDDFLRNPRDTLDWDAAPVDIDERRGQSDRFALKFVKPLEPMAPSTAQR
jgi:predicted methyltransferase